GILGPLGSLLGSSWEPLGASWASWAPLLGRLQSCCSAVLSFGAALRRISEAYPPAASHVLGLKETLQFLSIDSYHAPAARWCSEMGAASMREVAEHVEEFASALRLRPLELQRVRRWAKEELAKDAALRRLSDGPGQEREERTASAKAHRSTAQEPARPSLAVPVLGITIASAAGLKACDWNGKSDPYCKCWIQGQPDSEFQTPVVKKELSPAWNYWRALPDVPDVCALQFEVWDWDRFTKDDLSPKKRPRQKHTLSYRSAASARSGRVRRFSRREPSVSILGPSAGRTRTEPNRALGTDVRTMASCSDS
ncbi:unnamed protein product, partial [Prorocentrum cordatum]